MSEPVRYSEVSNDWNGENGGLAPSANGEWIKWDDYARLKAEVLTESQRWKQIADRWIPCNNMLEENARLKAEVEAYRSASDEVAAAFLALPSPHNQVGRVCEGIEHLKTEIERLNAELDQAKCDHDNCQKRKVRIDNHRFDLFTENNNLKAEVERLKAVNTIEQRTIQGLQNTPEWSEISRLTAWGRGLESDLSKAKVEVSLLKSDIEKLEKQVWRMKMLNGIENDTIKGLKAALKTAPEWSKVLEAIENNARLEVENDVLKTEIEQLRKAGEAMADCITEFRCGKYGNALNKIGGFRVWQDWKSAINKNSK